MRILVKLTNFAAVFASITGLIASGITGLIEPALVVIGVGVSLLAGIGANTLIEKYLLTGDESV